MFRLLIFAFLNTALIIGAPAQTEPQSEPSERLRQMAAELNLTDAQKEQLRPILAEEGQKLKALRDDTSLDRRTRMQKMRAIQEELQAKVKPILNDEQRKKWEAMRDEAREEMKKKRGGRRP